MNVFDIIGITILVLLAVKGFIKGLIAEVLGVASVILSIVVAVTFLEPFSKFLVHHAQFLPKMFVPLASFLVLLIGTYIAGQLTIKLLTHMVESLSLGIVNRVLGGIIGFFKGAILISLVVFLFSFILTNKTYDNLIKKNISLRICEPILPATYKAIKNKSFPLKSPEGIRKWLKQIEPLKKKAIEEGTEAVKEKVLDKGLGGNE
ncbi:MAG: hypothetical protein Kow00108_27050 [Calditrichia bacterium]